MRAAQAFQLCALAVTVLPPRVGVAQGRTVETRFLVPAGFQRTPLPAKSFGAWLRRAELHPVDRPVQLHTGLNKERQDVHLAVLRFDVGPRDLQQCADAVMRLRAEYLWASARASEICFRFSSGHAARWSDWARGLRPVVRGRHVRFELKAKADASRPTFRRYLDRVFTYAGSASLEKELRPVPAAAPVLPGDVLIQGGFPGHAVIVVDVVHATESRGRQKMLLAQSYMPAQDIHVLRNAGQPHTAWYDVPTSEDAPIRTPEWNFSRSDLKRFGASCSPVEPH